MPYKRTLCGLTLLCLTALVSGCATKGTSQILPPSSLLQDCPRPEPRSIQRNADLLQLILDQDAALASCNIDKHALRQWAEKVQP